MTPHRKQMHCVQLPIQSPSLVCVGGMLRVATAVEQHNASTPASTFTPAKPYIPSITSFTELATPFTTTCLFTAPTTPYTPSPLSSNNFSPSALPITPSQDLQPQPQTQLLTQKQVRELRRLCRKTANRAEFESRLIQIRQVASIAAMGSSSQHLFDPECPSSGHALRVWVDSYRAEGADWRDERPLSPAAVQELRRWDRLLKAWARIRFEPQASTDPHPIVHHLPPAPQDDLRPVRLQFERMSMATPPITPHYVRTAAINPVEVVPFPSPISPDASAYNIASPIIATPSTSTAADSSRSAWIKPPLSGLVRRVDARKPMAEVSINRVGDTINITVPTVAIPETPRGVDECFSGRDVARGDQENVYPPSKRTPAHASTTAKSWRTGSQDDAGEQSAMDERVVAFRMAAKSLFAGGSKEDGMIGVATPTTPHRPDMDWGKLRRNQVVNKTVLPTGGNDSVENA